MAEFTAAYNRLVDADRPGIKELRDVASRLADHGVVVYGDSQIESELYESAVNIEDELRDYFSFIRASLFHNPQFRYMRLFPTGARSPVLAGTEGAKEEAQSTTLRQRGNPHVSALLLALRAVYQQKLTTGADVVGNGEITATLEEIYVTMATRLKREPAPTQHDRRGALRELEQVWRVTRFLVESDLDDRQTTLYIRPMIADLISESVAGEVEVDAATVDGKEGERS